MPEGLRVVIGSDDAGIEYRQAIGRDLKVDQQVSQVLDIGVDRSAHTPYPEVARRAAGLIVAGEADRAVLICGTGLGMAISANKIHGIRAATAHDSFSVERSIMSNNAQILTLGQRVIGLELARRLVREWVGYRFDASSPSAAKVALIEGPDVVVG